MAKQTFTVGQVLTAAQLTSLQQTAMGGGAASAKTASYTLVAADAGTTISMTSTSATTITVNTGLFAAGDTVFIQNLGSGNLTITAGTATVATAGSLILPQNDAGILYFVSTSSSVFYDYIQAGAVSPLTTKGDLYTFSTSDARLGVGANNTVLTADSAEATGLKWATPSSGGMTLLDTVTLSGASVTSSTLSSSYKQFFIYIKGAYASAQEEFRMRLNADTGTNYAWQDSEFSTTTSFTRNGAQSSMRIGTISQVSAIKQTTNMAMTIMNPADTDSVFINCTSVWGAGASDILQERTVGVYDSAAAITSITLFPGSGTLTAGTAYIYGVN